MTSFKDIPVTPHFAIITQDSVTIPGDERSRTNPGHGYPEETRYYINYEVFPTRAAWLSKIKEYENPPSWSSKKTYKAIEVKPVKIKVNVEVETE